MPAQSKPRKKATRPTSTVAKASQIYTVQAGDTMYAIAARFGTTVGAIAKANNITNPNLIAVGQILVIPSSMGETLTVESQLTFFSTAEALNIRTRPEPSSQVVGVALKSQPLTVLDPVDESFKKIGVSGQWIRVRSQNGVEGYVAAQYVKVMNADKQPAELTLFPTAETLNIRARPEISSQIVGQASKSQPLTVLESADESFKKIGVSGQWIRVRSQTGVEGYITAQYVKAGNSVAQPIEREQNTEQSSGSSPQPAQSVERVPGIDVSYWNGEVDWAKVRASGQRFVFVKATEGTTYTDPTFDDNWRGAKSAGLLRGAYHFFRGNVDPMQQAEGFIKQVHAMNDNGELPPVLDLESNDGLAKTKLIPAVKIWLDAVEAAFGRKPIIYSGQYFLQDYLSETGGGPPAWANDHPLWLASYPNKYVEGSLPSLPRGWSKWTFWQYSEKGRVDGIKENADLNLFNGSLEELYRFAGLGYDEGSVGSTAPGSESTVPDSILSGQLADRQGFLNFAINDRPVGPDRLSYERYADAFAQVLSGEFTQTPLTVGIYASWGMGKSFLLGKIREKLKSIEQQDGKLRFAFIDFNAWVYSGSENLWAGLVTTLYNGIEDHYKTSGGDRLVQSYRRSEAWKQIKRTLTKSLKPILMFGVPAALISILLDFQAIQENWKTLIQALTLILGGAPLLAKIPDLVKGAKALLDSLVLLRSKELADLSSHKDFRDKVGFMADIQAELRYISDMINKIDEDENKKTRFVIFVDDLDRCPPEKAVEVLEAIMLLLSDRTKDPFVIFLAMDARVLVKAIEMRYGKVLTESGVSGYEFLDKIVQIPFRIPPAPDDAIKSYVKSLLYQSGDAQKKAEEPPAPEQSSTPDQADEAKEGDVSQQENLAPQLPEKSAGEEAVDRGATQPAGESEASPNVEKKKEDQPFTDEERNAFEEFSQFISRNPRRVKRIVNIYRLARILLESNVPLRVAIKWVILTEQWPFRIAWVMQKIEDDLQLDRDIAMDSDLRHVFESVQKYVRDERSHHLALLDEDTEKFDEFIKREPFITVDMIHRLWVVTFNLNPAMQNEVLKSALQVNGEATRHEEA